MASITLKGREIPLLLSTYELKQLQEEVATLGELNNVLFARNPDDETDHSRYLSTEHMEAVAKAVRIMGNAGLEEAGEEANLTEKMIMRSISPYKFPEVINACANAITEGYQSEIPEEKPDGPVDVTLEEMKKKKVKES